MDTIGQIYTTPQSVSSACRWFIPGMQDVASGVPFDRSGQGNSASIGANTTDAAVWANLGFITLADATAQDKGISLAPTKLAWAGNLGNSLLIAAQVKGSAPASTKRILGDRATGNGVGFEADATGKIQLVLRDGTTSYTSGFGSAVLLDGAVHTLILYVDGITKTATAWIDGVLLSQLTAANVAGSLVNSVVSSSPFSYGSDGAPTAAYTVASQWRNLHAYVKAGTIANAAALAARLTRDPFKPLSATEL